MTEENKKIPVRKLFVQATGLDGLTRGIDNSTLIDKKGYSAIKDMSNVLRSKEEENPILSLSNDSDPSKKYIDGMKQYGVTEDEMKKRLGSSYNMFFTYFIGLIAMITLFFVVSNRVSGIDLFAFTIPMLSMFGLLTISSLKWGFYNWQIRNKKIDSFYKFIKQPREWIPSKKYSNKLKSFIACLIVMSAMGLATPSQAHAEDATTTYGTTVTSVFKLPGDQDIFKNILENIFPNIGPLDSPHIFATAEGGTTATGMNGQSAFANAFEVFLAVLMATAMALLSFHMTQTIVSIAQEGKVFGQQWSLVWAPVRVFCGFGMLAPVVKGFCLAQIIVLYVALWGGSFGNLIMKGYIDGLTNPTVTSKYIPSLTPFVDSVIEKSACFAFVDAYNDMHRSTGGYAISLPNPTVSRGHPVRDGTLESNVANFGSSGTTPDAGIEKLMTNSDTSYGIKTGSGGTPYYYSWDFGVCGSVEGVFFTQSNVASVKEMEVQRQKDIDKFVSKILPPMKVYAASQVVKDGKTDINMLSGQIKSTVEDSYNELQMQWISGATKMLQGINSNMNGYTTAFKETFSNYGWAEAGSYYTTFARMQSMTDAILQKTPVTTTALDKGNNYGVNTNATGSSGSAPTQTYNLNLPDYLINASSEKDILENEKKITDLATMASGFVDLKSVTTVAQIASQSANGVKAGIINGITENGGDHSDYAMLEAIHWVVNGISDALARMINGIGSLLGASSVKGDEYQGHFGNSTTGGALQQLVDFGHNCMDIVGYIATALIAAMFLAKAASILKSFLPSGLVKLGGAVGSAGAKVAGATNPIAKLITGFASTLAGSLGFILEMLFAFLAALEVIGIFHGYILPMIPYIHFLFFFMGVVTFVVEAMIAAPLWAFVHIRLDGQQFLDQNKTGYLLLFNLFLRIPLGLFGLFTSIIVFDSVVMFLDMTFYPAMQSALGAYSNGPIAMITFLVMLAYIHYQLAIRSFSLISALPNKVSQWMGAGGAAHDDSGAENQSHGLTSFLSGQVASKAGGYMSGGAKNAIGHMVGSREPAKEDGEETQRTQATQNTNGGGGGSGGMATAGSLAGGVAGGPAGNLAGGVVGSAVDNITQQDGGEGATHPSVQANEALQSASTMGGSWHDNLAKQITSVNGNQPPITGDHLQESFGNMRNTFATNPTADLKNTIRNSLKGATGRSPSNDAVAKVMDTLKSFNA